MKTREPETVPEIDLRITIEEANLVLEGLGGLAFARVHALIAKVQTQASDQLTPRSATESEEPEDAS